MRENEIEVKLMDAVKERGGVCWKFVSPGTAGVPDRIILAHSATIARPARRTAVRNTPTE